VGVLFTANLVGSTTTEDHQQDTNDDEDKRRSQYDVSHGFSEEEIGQNGNGQQDDDNTKVLF
jgi:hypothetical protein